MGFWHTGYMDMFQPTGLDHGWSASPREYRCSECGRTFASPDDVRSHRFEAHPLRRPLLYIRGIEAGVHPLTITRPLTPADVGVAQCDAAFFNGRRLPLSSLSRELASTTSGSVRVELRNGPVHAEFSLNYRIATDDDLAGVESEFRRIAQRGRLDTQVVQDFINATEPFTTAIGFVDGICSYLYGELAKEKASDSSLDYEAYHKKFAAAADKLACYEMPLARTVASLIEFHFNHFADCAALLPGSRVGSTAARFESWIIGHPSGSRGAVVPADQLESLVTDWQTEQILRWSAAPLDHVEEISERLTGHSAEFDKVKLHLLLGEALAANGRYRDAMKHAKALRNLPAFEGWAERLLNREKEEES